MKHQFLARLERIFFTYEARNFVETARRAVSTISRQWFWLRPREACLNDRGAHNLTGTVLLAAMCGVFFMAPLLEAAQIGQKVTDFRLPDTSGRMHSLASHLASGKIVVVAFWSFKCSTSLTSNEKLAALHEKYRNRGVVVLAVASNANESAAEIQKNAANLNLPFTILVDKDGTLAERLEATHTPHVFIIDRDGTLRYRGALDNNKQPGEGGRIAFAEDVLDAILAGKPVSQPETRTFGCSIKRKSL
jgi:peroxiredoxin